MTQTRRGVLQSRILDSIKVQDRTVTDSVLADAMGVDRSLVSRYRSGEREMGLGELAGLLAAGFPAGLVLGPLAAVSPEAVRVVVDSEAGPAVPLGLASARLTRAAAGFSEAVAEAVADGRLTDEEAEDLDRRRMQLDAEVGRLLIRAGRVAS